VPQSFVRDSRQDELIITDVGMREVFWSIPPVCSAEDWTETNVQELSPSPEVSRPFARQQISRILCYCKWLASWSEFLTTYYEVPGSIRFFIDGEDALGDHGLGSLVELRFKAPPGTSYSYITIHIIGTT
jgi:hypothetical protein